MRRHRAGLRSVVRVSLPPKDALDSRCQEDLGRGKRGEREERQQGCKGEPHG